MHTRMHVYTHAFQTHQKTSMVSSRREKKKKKKPSKQASKQAKPTTSKTRARKTKRNETNCRDPGGGVCVPRSCTNPITSTNQNQFKSPMHPHHHIYPTSTIFEPSLTCPFLDLFSSLLPQPLTNKTYMFGLDT